MTEADRPQRERRLAETADLIDHVQEEIAARTAECNTLIGIANRIRSDLGLEPLPAHDLSNDAVEQKAVQEPKTIEEDVEDDEIGLLKHRQCPRCGWYYGTYSNPPHRCGERGNSWYLYMIGEYKNVPRKFRVSIPETYLDDEPKISVIDEPTQKRPGLREGSKRQRIYQATSDLLIKHGSMHIDDMFSEVESLGVFEYVKDPRTNFSNFLSQLKTRGFLVSDHRGNWSLPVQRTRE